MSITRVEIIGPDGREFSRWYDYGLEARACLQDEGRTLKLFLDKIEPKE